MKRLTYTAFIAFWTCLFTLLIVQQLSPPPATASDGQLPTYTLDELAKHGTEHDCWMAIEGKVYDFSSYIPKHPTAPAIIAAWCGRDATAGMRTKGYGRDHSTSAWTMANDYLIGQLGK